MKSKSYPGIKGVCAEAKIIRRNGYEKAVIWGVCLALILSMAACGNTPTDNASDGSAAESTTKTTASSTTTTAKGYKSYASFLENLASQDVEMRYAIHNIDHDEQPELLISERGTKLTIYKMLDCVTEIGNEDFQTGTVRWFFSTDKEHPGVFYFTVGGGADHYSRMTIQDNKLHFEALWDDVYAYSPTSDISALTVRYRVFTDNKELVKESKRLYDQNQDIQWTSVK